MKLKYFYYFLFFLLVSQSHLMSLGLKDRNKISIKGSETMLELSYILAKYYVQNKDVHVNIQIMGGGSGVGIASMINGISDLANGSRKIKSKELDKIALDKEILNNWIIALDALIIYVNHNNPVTVIKAEDLKKVYLGKITNWKELGGHDESIILYGREGNSGSYTFFKEKILENDNFYYKIINLSGNGSIVSAVGNDSNSIGYGGYTENSKVKFLKINYKGEVKIPDLENIKKMNYPFMRPLYIYALEHSLRKKPYILNYINWILTEEAQSLIQSSGYFPVNR